jgi:hypothetical protein
MHLSKCIISLLAKERQEVELYRSSSVQNNAGRSAPEVIRPMG